MDNGMEKPKIDKITVQYEKFKKLAAAIEELKPTNDSELSFEFIVGSLFPNILDNIKKEIMNQYTKGYLTGLNEKES